jgi:hypothetical protein
MVPDEFCEPSDRGRRVDVDLMRQMGLDRSEPLLDESLCGRCQTFGVEPFERRACPLRQRGLDITGIEQPLEPDDVDRRRVDVEPVGSTDPDDGPFAQLLPQPGDIGLQRLLRGPRRVVAPHHRHQAGDRHHGPGPQREGSEDGLALRRSDINLFASFVDCADSAEESYLLHRLCPSRLLHLPIGPVEWWARR